MKTKLGIALVLVALCYSCGGKKQQNKESMTINMGVMSSMDYFPLAVAKAKGYFQKEGVEVNIQKFFSANDRDAAIQGGKLDGSILDYTGAAIQRSKGVKILLTSQCDGVFQLIAGKHLSEPIDMKGKNFALSRNTVVDFCTDMILKSKNINPLDITTSEINKIPLRLEMLRNAKVDFSVLPDPFASIAKADGCKEIASMNDLGYHITGIVLTEDCINNKPEAIKALYRAYNLAIKDIQQNPISNFNDILAEEIGFPKPILDKIQLPNYSEAKLPQKKDLEAISVWLKSKEILSEDFDIATLVNNDFAGL